MSSEPTCQQTPGWGLLAERGADPESLCCLATADAGKLNGPDLVDAIVASEKALSLLAGLQMRLMDALAAPFVAGDPMRLASRLARKSCMSGVDSDEQVELFVPEAATCLAAAEIAAALRISPVTAGIRVREAATMTADLTPTLQALEAGRLDRGKARVIAEHCQPLTAEHTAAVQQIVLGDADQLSTSELRDLTGQAVITVDPTGAEERHRAAAARRELTLRAQPDAMATLSAFLPADGAVKIFQISDLLATGTAGSSGDPRGVGARRVDALVDIADQLLTNGYLDLTHYLDHALPDTAAPSSPRTARRGDDTTDERDNREGGSATGRSLDREQGPGREHGPGHEQGPGREQGPDSEGRPDVAGRCDEASPVSTDQSPADPATTCPESSDSPGGAHTADPSPENPSATAEVSQHGTVNRSRVLTRQGRRPHLSVTIGMRTLAGLDELPAVLAGFGAIPACLGRAIAMSAGTVTALITDPTSGTVTEAGALTYRPHQRLRDQVAAMVTTCQFPSCRQPVWRCDIDHRVPFEHDHPERGGRSDSTNAGPFCRRHHLVKHHTDWRIRVSPERFTLELTSPTGHRYSSKPRPPLLPDLRVTTAGSALAERLDLVTAMGAASMTRDGGIEDHATALLLRHELNKPPAEYDSLESAWDSAAPDRLGGDRTDRRGRTDRTDPTDDPPF